MSASKEKKKNQNTLTILVKIKRQVLLFNKLFNRHKECFLIFLKNKKVCLEAILFIILIKKKEKNFGNHKTEN